MTTATLTQTESNWVREHLFLGKDFAEYVRSLLTPWNFVAMGILAVGLPVIAYRFLYGLAASTHMTDLNPWGFWLGFDMFFGVAVATGGFSMVMGVYIFNKKEYQSMVRPAVLTGFLGYFFAILGLVLDLGRPWRLPYPFIFFGTASVMFLVAEHLALYLTVQFVEFMPALVEWLHLKAIRRWLDKIHLGAVILGAVMVLGHQSALGALFLIMPTRLHPLWYSAYLPQLFFVSCLAGGIAMLIVESMISHRVFGFQVKREEHHKIEQLTIGLGKAAAFILFAYLCLKVLTTVHEMQWGLLFSAWGAWLGVEVIGFTAVPLVLYVAGVHRSSLTLVRVASVLTVLGILLNRLNVVVIALNWNGPEVYYPSWMEVWASLTIVTIGVITFRWIMNRMPILYRLPEFPDEH